MNSSFLDNGDLNMDITNQSDISSPYGDVTIIGGITRDPISPTVDRA